MDNIYGNWSGAYTINDGTEDSPDIKYFHFDLRLKGDDGSFEGKFIDRTLRTEVSKVHGFVEEDFISMVRISVPSPELLEFLSFDLEDGTKEIEFNLSGNYVDDDKAWEGFWELEIDSENEGFQDSILQEMRTGGWYMRKL